MSHLINIFLEPAKVFADLREKPAFLAPMLVVILVGMASILAYFLQVDPVWFEQHQIAQVRATNPEMSEAELQQMQQFMPGARVSMVIMLAMSVLMPLLVWLLLAVYYLMAGKVAGNDVGFRRGFALAVWSSMPITLASLMALVGAFVSSPQTGLEQIQYLNADQILGVPVDSAWLTVSRSFSLVYLWVWLLAAMGWKVWFRSSWTQALFVVLLPWVLYYGVLSLIAAL